MKNARKPAYKTDLRPQAIGSLRMKGEFLVDPKRKYPSLVFTCAKQAIEIHETNEVFFVC